ncbi:hypothetical protein CLV63_12828 [Murinocardiopsis flavida]|uniref:Alkylation response protein AidB-like acyl-CoA dehydrogenase n=1 Tax=Murinocardiopsis flavida TaxID=645275 RepID=A0A2P8CVG7_9ACTN|nr:acyl-CoA dehydrogenase family protein [Murinocardiopsis flavida]PSK88940.1 hypothetical protein CLV63_12828 [Murinocardiopsis flavida]
MSADPVPADLDLLYDDVEEGLRASVRSLLADRCPWSAVLERVETDAPTDVALWKELAAMGVAGLPVPERLGGAGATLRETAVAAEELGRAVAPVPFLGSAVLATTALLAAGGEAADGALARLASGEVSAALAVPLATAPDTPFPQTVRYAPGAPGSTSSPDSPADGRAASGTLTGEVGGVADASTAGILVVPAVGADGPGLYLVEADSSVRLPVTSLDLTRPLATVRFDGAAARPVATGPAAADALHTALVSGAAVLASEQLGVAEWALTTTVDYLKTRYQFGRPVGSFQAVKHRLADLWVAVSQARAVARNAASAAVHGGPEAALDAALAQAFVSDTAVLAAEEAVQLHGGIGFTWEHPTHLYLKRAKADALALGSADRHRMTIARLADLPPAQWEA